MCTDECGDHCCLLFFLGAFFMIPGIGVLMIALTTFDEIRYQEDSTRRIICLLLSAILLESILWCIIHQLTSIGLLKIQQMNPEYLIIILFNRAQLQKMILNNHLIQDTAKLGKKILYQVIPKLFPCLV